MSSSRPRTAPTTRSVKRLLHVVAVCGHSSGSVLTVQSRAMGTKCGFRKVNEVLSSIGNSGVGCSCFVGFTARRQGEAQVRAHAQRYTHCHGDLNCHLSTLALKCFRFPCVQERTICCILENYQTDKGIKVPAVLVRFHRSQRVHFQQTLARVAAKVHAWPVQGVHPLRERGTTLSWLPVMTLCCDMAETREQERDQAGAG